MIPSWMPAIYHEPLEAPIVRTAYQWVRNSDGNMRWGPEGAAGILFHHPQTNTYLLTHRSPEVHMGDTWGIPGGAIDPGESPYQAALRESQEGLGQVPQHTVTGIYEAAPVPDWKYHTVMADVPQQFEPEYADSWETQGHGWFTPEEVQGLKLHPGFASAWNSGALGSRTAMANGFFYHTAPAKYRKQIEAQGLLPTSESPVSPWAHKTGPEREQQPQGVYMWDNPENAKGYAYNIEGRKGAYPGDKEEEGFDDDVFESPEYYKHMEKFKGEPHTDEYYDYESEFEPPRKPLYDVWKVNTLGYEPQIDPEMAIHHGELTAQEAQEQMNSETRGWKGEQDYDPWNIERSEGHRWYVPHAIEPARLTLHHTMYPEDMTERNWEDLSADQKQVPNAWHQVPLNEWNENAQKRYLGDPNLMREIDPGDRTR